MDAPLGIAAGPLPNARWLLAYARLGYGLLTYRTVRSAEAAAWPVPNLVPCRFGDPCVAERAPRRLDPGALTWAVSLGLPSPAPEVWRADVRRARDRLAQGQLLIVSVAGTPDAGTGADSLADDYARCAAWAAEAGADAVELHLGGPAAAGDPGRLVFEDADLSVLVAARCRRALGRHRLIVKLGAFPGPRPLHELASRLAPWVDGFCLVDGVHRRLVREDGSPALPGRPLPQIAGAGIWEHCRVQVEELVAWRKAGAWNQAILAVGGITTAARARAALSTGADAAMVATAALTDPLLAIRWRQEAARAPGA